MKRVIFIFMIAGAVLTDDLVAQEKKWTDLVKRARADLVRAGISATAVRRKFVPGVGDAATEIVDEARVLVSEGATFKGMDEMVYEGQEADAFGHKKLGGIGDIVSKALKETSAKFNHGQRINVINQRLGYLVRCGNPDALDSIVPMAFGNLAMDLVLDGVAAFTDGGPSRGELKAGNVDRATRLLGNALQGTQRMGNVKATQALKVGDPLEKDTQVGPMAREDLRDDLDKQVRATVAQGAKVLLGGEPMNRPGAYYPPTILAGVTVGERALVGAGSVVTRTMLLENVWDYHFDPQTNVIDVHISRLRSKIDKGFSQPLLHTIRGAGYMIRDGAR